MSGGRGDGHGETEGLELANVLAGFAAGVDAVGIVGQAQVGVAGVRVGQQVLDGDQGFEFAAAADDAA